MKKTSRMFVVGVVPAALPGRRLLSGLLLGTVLAAVAAAGPMAQQAAADAQPPAAVQAGVAAPALVVSTCTASDLIAAITSANTAGPPTTITLLAGCTYTLTAPTNWVDGPNGLPDITGTISIAGNGVTIARSTAPGTAPFRLFHVSAGANLTLQQVTIANGLARGGNGGSGFIGGGGGAGMGGALFDHGGSVTISMSTVTGNHALGGNGAAAAAGTGGGGGGGGMGGNGGSGVGGLGGGGGGTHTDGQPGAAAHGGAGGDGNTPGSGGSGGTAGSTTGSDGGIGGGGGGGGPDTGGCAGSGDGGAGGFGGGGGGISDNGVCSNNTGGFGGGGGGGDFGGGFGGGGGGRDGGGTFGGDGGAFTGGAFGGGGGAGLGGAVYVYSGLLTLDQTTLTGNSATGGSAGDANAGAAGAGKGKGGALFVDGTGIDDLTANPTASLSCNVFSGNTARDAAGTATDNNDVYGVSVSPCATTVTLTSSGSPAVYDQSISFTAVIRPSPSAGAVTFTDGAATLGTVAVNNGTAVLTTSSLAVGTHSISASFSGGGASTTLSQLVNKDGTTTTLTSAANPSTLGQAVAFIVRVVAVAPGSGIPAGNVTFMDGATVQTTATLNAVGIATVTTSALAVGTHSITAVYVGSGTFTGSTAAALSQVVHSLSGSTTTTLTSSSNPSTVGQWVTFTAHVTGSGTPTGSVTLKDGTTFLGTGTLGSGAISFSTSALTVGTHSITAVYGGSATFTGSTAAALTQTVNKAGTTTTLTSSSSASIHGQTITFTARVAAVAPGSGIPTGAVIFMDGATELSMGTLNAIGIGRFTTWTLALGTHSITAFYTTVYGGSGTFTGSTSAILTQTVYKVSSDWAPCAGENGTCSFFGTRTVAYGANGLYTYRTVTTATACNDSVFGDPIPNTVKACYSTPLPDPNAWTQCAPENGSCSFAGTQVVAYGANGHFAYRTITNGTACNDSIFGDPIPNTVQACYAMALPGGDAWAQCTPENGSCSFAGTQVVAYGANGLYTYRTITNGTACNDSIFGNPIPNTLKVCYLTALPAGGAWARCAPENGSCSFAGTMVVAYGANGLYSYRTITNGTACNDSIFGDPVPNTVKACYALSQPG